MKNPTDSAMLTSPEYRQFIENLKARVVSARISAARAMNCDLILLYWDIGHGIMEKQQALGWGESVVEMVAVDLQQAFPGTTGFSPRNLRSAKQLFLSYSDSTIWLQAVAKLPRGAKVDDSEIWPQAAAKLTNETVIGLMRKLVAEVPWGQNLLILNKLSDPVAQLYYLRATAQFGWSRNVLLNQIKAGAYERAVIEKKTHNFPLALRTKKNPIGVAVYQLQSKLPADLKGIEEGEIRFSNLDFVDEVHDDLLLETGDLLYNRTNSPDQVGKAAIFRKSRTDAVTFASYLVRLRVNHRADALFLNYVFNCDGFLGFARRLAIPSVQQSNLNSTRYSRMFIPLPPIREQGAIRAHLDEKIGEVKHIITGIESQISTLTAYRKSLIHECVTGQRRVTGADVARANRGREAK